MKALRLAALLSLGFALSVAAFPVEDYAAGVPALGLARWTVALGEPDAFLDQPAALGFAALSEVSLDAARTGELSTRLIGHYGLGIVKPMRTESATLGRVNTVATLAVALQQLVLTGETRGSQSVAALSLGSEISRGLSVGLNLKTLSVETPELVDSGFGLDLGVQGRFGDFLVGVVAHNLIPPGLEYPEGTRVVERRLSLGAGWRPLEWVGLALEGTYLPASGGYDFGPALRLSPVDGDVWRVVLSGGYRVEERLWAVGASLRYTYLEIAGALFAGLDDDDTRLALRLTLIPEF